MLPNTSENVPFQNVVGWTNDINLDTKLLITERRAPHACAIAWHARSTVCASSGVQMLRQTAQSFRGSVVDSLQLSNAPLAALHRQQALHSRFVDCVISNVHESSRIRCCLAMAHHSKNTARHESCRSGRLGDPTSTDSGDGIFDRNGYSGAAAISLPFVGNARRMRSGGR